MNMENRSNMTLFFVLISLLAIFKAPQLVNAADVPSIFILGDSTADVGTNNYVPNSVVRADFRFYGIDFPHSRATGRFSNGFNSADLLAKLMGFKRSPPPFLFLVYHKHGRLHKKFLKGVNFASAGSGLLDSTGWQLGVVPLSEQIKQFATVRSNISAAMGLASTEKLLSKSVFCISTGSNDIFGFFFTNSTIPKDKFIAELIGAYKVQIKALHKLGARKFGIISVPPIGCCPANRLANDTGGCLEAMNDFAISFHSAISSLLCNLSSELHGFKYSLGNTYEMTINVIEHPDLFKLNVDTACCGFGTLNAEYRCNSTANLCSNRRRYLFWDLFHPTQAAADMAAQTLYTGPLRFVSPINFAQLAAEN